MRGLSLVVASGGHSSSRCAGLSPSQPLSLWSTGSRRAGSAIVAHGPSCSAACGIFPDPGSNPCSLHWQADSQPLHHQGSPPYLDFESRLFLSFGSTYPTIITQPQVHQGQNSTISFPRKHDLLPPFTHILFLVER